MPRGNVKATRMELQRFKRQLKMAKRGHKLLKEKRDGLMSAFLKIIRDIKELRTKIENELIRIYTLFLHGYSYLKPEDRENVFGKPDKNLMINVTFNNVMGVKLPKFLLNKENIAFKGFWDNGMVSLNLDVALIKLKDLLESLIRLAEIEKGAIMLASEIESTRRRVNALEYVLIPELEENISYIMMKIGEMERSTISMLMKVKEIVRKEK